MARRTAYDALQPVPRRTWLVTRNQNRRPLASAEIAAGADLRAILEGARSERIAGGWSCTNIGRSVGFFFAERDGERLQIGIECFDPHGPGPPGHRDPAP